MKVKSSQPNIIASHKGSPSYEIEFGSEPVEVSEEIAEHLVNSNPHFKIVEESKDSSQYSEYKEELTKIKGIGKKTAKDIMVVFETKESLIKEIGSGKELPFDDDVTDKLKNKYGNERL